MNHFLKGLLLTALALPMTAIATCPNLSGDFLCSAQGQSVTTRVLQEVRDGATVYTVISDAQDLEVITDGNRHQTEVTDPNIRNASYVAQCRSNGLSVVTTADVFVNGRSMGRATTDFEMNLTSNNNVQTLTTIRLGNRTFPTVRANCQRI